MPPLMTLPRLACAIVLAGCVPLSAFADDAPRRHHALSLIGEPRYPPLRGIMAAGRAPIPAWGAAELGLPAEQLTAARQLRRLYAETRESQAELIQADTPEAAGEQLALKLREAKLI